MAVAKKQTSPQGKIVNDIMDAEITECRHNLEAVVGELHTFFAIMCNKTCFNVFADIDEQKEKMIIAIILKKMTMTNSDFELKKELKEIRQLVENNAIAVLGRKLMSLENNTDASE